MEVLTSDFRFFRNAQQLAEALLGIASGGGDLVPPEKPAKVDAERLKEYEGLYQLAGGSSLRVKADSDGITLGSDDAATVRKLKLAENAMAYVESHAKMLNEKLEKCLDALKDGDSKPLREAMPKVPTELAKHWIELISGSKELGKIKSHEVYGNYLVTGTMTYQFVRITYEKGKAVFLFVWDANKLYAIAPATETATSSEFIPAGEGRFYRDSADTWRTTWVRIEAGKDRRAARLVVSGIGQALVGER